MIYLFVIILSLVGIVFIVGARGLLRSRNARRIVRAIRSGFSSVRDRNAKLLPDSPIAKEEKNPRTQAFEFQQSRTLLRAAEKARARKDIDLAERSLIQALMLQPEDMEVRGELALLYLDTSREKKAEALYKEILKSRKNVVAAGASTPLFKGNDASLLATVYVNLGHACYRQGKFLGACRAYQEALNREPQNPVRCYDLGRACAAAGHLTEAASLLERAATGLSKDLQLLHLLARCYEQLSENEKVIDTYSRINRLDPRDEETKKKLLQLRAVA